ncbi:MAG: sulfatase, partial [Cytophagales bacterium]|nr:sulfatase [Cytophagales bacterium]
QRALVWHYPHYGNQGGDPASMLRRGDHKLIYYWETDHFELYDLSQDIGEQNDISADRVALATRLKKELFESLDQVKYKRPRPNPYFSEQARDERMRKVTQVWLPNLEDRRLQILEEAFQPNEDWWGSATTD